MGQWTDTEEMYSQHHLEPEPQDPPGQMRWEALGMAWRGCDHWDWEGVRPQLAVSFTLQPPPCSVTPGLSAPTCRGSFKEYDKAHNSISGVMGFANSNTVYKQFGGTA